MSATYRISIYKKEDGATISDNIYTQEVSQKYLDANPQIIPNIIAVVNSLPLSLNILPPLKKD
jgi:hypothetical protein